MCAPRQIEESLGLEKKKDGTLIHPGNEGSIGDEDDASQPIDLIVCSHPFEHGDPPEAWFVLAVSRKPNAMRPVVAFNVVHNTSTASRAQVSARRPRMRCTFGADRSTIVGSCHGLHPGVDGDCARALTLDDRGMLHDAWSTEWSE